MDMRTNRITCSLSLWSEEEIDSTQCMTFCRLLRRKAFSAAMPGLCIIRWARNWDSLTNRFLHLEWMQRNTKSSDRRIGFRFIAWSGNSISLEAEGREWTAEKWATMIFFFANLSVQLGCWQRYGNWPVWLSIWFCNELFAVKLFPQFSYSHYIKINILTTNWKICRKMQYLVWFISTRSIPPKMCILMPL